MSRMLLSFCLGTMLMSAPGVANAQDSREQGGENPRVEAGREQPDRVRPDDRRPAGHDELRQRLENMRQTLHRLREQEAEPERQEEIERAIQSTERELDERMHRGREVPRREVPRREVPRRDVREPDAREREMREREVRARGHEDRERPQMERPQMERLEHLHHAAEHLRQAGLGELSDRVMEQIREMEHVRAEGSRQHDGGQPEFRELQNQMNELRRMVEELREQIERFHNEQR